LPDDVHRDRRSDRKKWWRSSWGGKRVLSEKKMKGTNCMEKIKKMVL